MRLLALLLLPAALLLGAAYLEGRVVPNSPPPPSARLGPEGIVWGGRVFADRRDLARWLRARGASYDDWVRRHPRLASPRPATAGAVQSTAHREAEATTSRHDNLAWVRPLIGGILVLSTGSVLAWRFGRRRRTRPTPPAQNSRDWLSLRPARRARRRRRHPSAAQLAPSGRRLATAASRGKRRLVDGIESFRNVPYRTAQSVVALRHRHSGLGWYLAACLLAVAMGLLLPHTLP